MITMDVWHAIQVLKRQGKAKKAIARELGLSKNTVKRYWRSEGPPRYTRKPSGKRLDAFGSQIRAMMEKGYIGTRIYEEIKAMGFVGSLSSVYRFIEEARKETKRADKATIRFETEPGRQMQYDWKEWSVPIDGKAVKVYFHQAILSYSRFKFMSFSLDITTQSIVRFLAQAIEAFGGAPEEIVIDNPKQMVLSHDRDGTIRYQEDFLVFLGSHGIKPDPCMNYRARTKGKVENPFFYLQEHFLRGLEVEGLSDLEGRLASFLLHCNKRVHSTTGRAPEELLKDEHLRARPVEPAVSFSREPRKVSWDGYVHVDSNRYPVSLALAGQRVWIERNMGRWIEIFDRKMQRVGRFETIRESGVTLPHPEHAALSKEYAERKAERRARGKRLFLEAFPAIGEAFVELAEEKYKGNAAYHLKRIVDLLSIYDKEALEEAIRESARLGCAAVEDVCALVPERLREPSLEVRSPAAAVCVAKRSLAEYSVVCAEGGEACSRA